MLVAAFVAEEREWDQYEMGEGFALSAIDSLLKRLGLTAAFEAALSQGKDE